MEVQSEDQLLRVITLRFFRLGIAACATIIFLAGVVVVLALRPRVPPYVIAVDNGRIVGYAHPFTGTDKLARMVIEQQLRQFIYDARAVSNNDQFEQRNIRTVYAIARGQASRVLDAYYGASPDNDPLKLGRIGDWRDVKILDCVGESEPNTYRVEWTETLHSQTDETTTSSWVAIMKIVIGLPDAGNDLNPTGLYVINLDLQETEMK